jgi:hypothetical protein
MRVLRTGVMAFLCLALVPAVAWAQASITGVVKDSSGAVLPGVTVEAASPALLELDDIRGPDQRRRPPGD